MKASSLLLPLLMLLASAFANEASANRQRFPPEFESVDAATKWVRGTFAGGKVETVKPATGTHLVIFEHGSGIPVIRIGLYQRTSDKWRLTADFPPPSQSGEFLTPSVRDDRIVLVGERSGRIWPLPESE